jgi:hypothetical protein
MAHLTNQSQTQSKSNVDANPHYLLPTARRPHHLMQAAYMSTAKKHCRLLAGRQQIILPVPFSSVT